MVSEKERTAKPQEKDKEEQGQQVEVTAEKDDKAKAAVEAEEFFDPETADRDALLLRIKELEGRLEQAEERVLRTAADAENFKKRLQREKEEQTRYANETFMRELLPVIDNLERALQHSADAPNQEGLVDGLNMTLKGFFDTLARFGCTVIEAIGKTFDPNFHEAVSQEESSKVEPNTVLKELQKGYMLKERLLRPAMVIVSKPPSEAERDTRDQNPTETKRAKSGEVKIPVRKA
ncbi:MAG: nucleotide exchange factor GrpE [Syntrophobacteria bacterium]